MSNAGAAWQGKIGEVSDDVLRRSFELNFFAHQSVAQNAVRVMRAQGIGGGGTGCLMVFVYECHQCGHSVPGCRAEGGQLPNGGQLFVERPFGIQ